MSETKILVPYDEYTKMVKDSAELGCVIALLSKDFEDASCQMFAIKSILGMIPDADEEEIVEPNPEPTPDDNEENEETTEPVEP